MLRKTNERAEGQQAFPPKPDKELSVLLRRYAAVQEDGFAIGLSSAPGRWDRCLKRLGSRVACEQMAAELCRAYQARFGAPFLLTEACVAWEIRYHADAYLAAAGYKGYRRHASTLLFSKETLVRHCGEVNISLGDLTDLKQRLMFRYRQGIRACYRHTEKDPFHR